MKRNWNMFFIVLVVFIILFSLLWEYYPWWVSLLNSIAIIIVAFLLRSPVKKINSNRKRYYSSWLPSILFGILFLILFNLRNNFPFIAVIWTSLIFGFLISIIFPEKPKVEK